MLGTSSRRLALFLSFRDHTFVLSFTHWLGGTSSGALCIVFFIRCSLAPPLATILQSFSRFMRLTRLCTAPNPTRAVLWIFRSICKCSVNFRDLTKLGYFFGEHFTEFAALAGKKPETCTEICRNLNLQKVATYLFCMEKTANKWIIRLKLPIIPFKNFTGKHEPNQGPT